MTAIVGIVVGLTFLFGFGNVATLGVRLGVPTYVAFLVAPAVDFSVVALLLIGWTEVAPALLHAMQAIEPRAELAGPPAGGVAAGAAVPEQFAAPGPSPEWRPEQREASRLKLTAAREQDLLHRARAEDVLHWQQHQRPISAETLRRRLRIGTPAARRLVAELRSDTHARIEGNSIGLTSGEPPQVP
ncbi:hypothetical protein [Parafrankia elaeagni]|uniref:hypothetical protein n=1 Tax=Parafrankia elaeagni TaxID=222534 RepID=UPI00036C3C5B|nr:hypothetical protein [Parafrankia elaeagni]